MLTANPSDRRTTLGTSEVSPSFLLERVRGLEKSALWDTDPLRTLEGINGKNQGDVSDEQPRHAAQGVPPMV